MKNIKINCYVTIVLSLMVASTLFSCKKEIAQKEEKKGYTQYFNATVDNKSINIRNSMDKDRFKFHGSWTGLGMANGDQVDMYEVKVSLPKELLNSTDESKLKFHIYDLKKRQYQISSDFNFDKHFSTHIYLLKNAGMVNEVMYSTSSLKKPFHIEITKYDYPEGSIVPIVGGKINGVLYNVTSLRDSIVIKNGDFEVRY